MIQKRALLGVLVAVVLLGMVPVVSMAGLHPVRLVQEGQNLLQNPGFEGITCDPNSAPGWCNDNWTRKTFNGAVYSEIYTPQGWVTFWSEGKNPVDGRNYGRPECKVIPRKDPFVGPPARINSGNYAVMQFGFYRSIDSGIYQTVTGLTPGATVRLSAYAHSWTCGDDDHAAFSCGDPHQMLFRVGIDPNGGTDPWNPGIVWASGYSRDEFRMIGPVETQVGEAGTVTVFLRATAKWSYKHNDVYWDDASLVYTTPPEPPTDTPPPPPPTNTPGPSPTPRNTPTPRPDGATVHIVESGDTLYGIALAYNVDADQIRQLNSGTIGANDMLWPGMELVISLPSQTPTPLPSPTTEAPTAVPGTPATGTQPGTGTTTGASICVLAYHDRNGNSSWESEDEELLPNAEFTVASTAGVVERYTSDGVHEPHCFTSLEAGAYRVIMNSPPGYTPHGSAEWPVAVAEGTSLDVYFGNVRSENPTGLDEETPAPTPASGETGDSTSDFPVKRIFATVARVSGIMVLVLAVGVAILFVLNRRRM